MRIYVREAVCEFSNNGKDDVALGGTSFVLLLVAANVTKAAKSSTASPKMAGGVLALKVRHEKTSSHVGKC